MPTINASPNARDSFQRLHMTRMQKIKATIGKNDALIAAMRAAKFQNRVMQ